MWNLMNAYEFVAFNNLMIISYYHPNLGVIFLA
jgi:hypothetical protein